MLSDEESSFAVGLDGGFFEGGDMGVEIFDRGGGDGDQAGVAQDTVAGSGVGLLLENVVVLSRLGVILDLSDTSMHVRADVLRIVAWRLQRIVIVSCRFLTYGGV